jgi:hypothetical protein
MTACRPPESDTTSTRQDCPGEPTAGTVNGLLSFLSCAADSRGPAALCGGVCWVRILPSAPTRLDQELGGQLPVLRDGHVRSLQDAAGDLGEVA